MGYGFPSLSPSVGLVFLCILKGCLWGSCVCLHGGGFANNIKNRGMKMDTIYPSL